jgi:hypothetical protein
MIKTVLKCHSHASVSNFNPKKVINDRKRSQKRSEKVIQMVRNEFIHIVWIYP